MIKLPALDWLALGICLCVTGVSFHRVYGGEGGPVRVYLRNESQSWVYPLEEERQISVPGPLGETHVTIRSGGAAVTDSPCRDKLCIAMGHVSRPGGWIACLPNRVFLRIDAGEEGEVDAAVY